jgi:hypothetical protein
MQRLVSLCAGALAVAAFAHASRDLQSDSPDRALGDAGQDETRRASSSDDPLAPFERMIGGRWKMTTPAGRDTYDTWRWGPGRSSIRALGEGTLTEGDPWRTLAVFYTHPGDRTVRWFGAQSVMRGVAEGTVVFDGDRAEGEFTLHQSAGPRALGLRWTFDGPDQYRDELLDKIPGGFALQNAWTRRRVPSPAPNESPAAESRGAKATASEFMRPFEGLLGRAWLRDPPADPAATRPAAAGRLRTAFEYLPHVDVVVGRIDRVAADGTSVHTTDLYLYHHTGARTLRFLALTVEDAGRERVFEGDIGLSADGRALDLRIQEPRANGAATHEASLELPVDDAVRLRVWNSKDRAGPTILDVRYRREAQ